MFPEAHKERKRTGLQVLSWFLAGTLTACGPAGPPEIQTEFSDSAGVTIAESSGLPEPGAGGWVLDGGPTLSIGTLDGDSLHQFFTITGGVRLFDGRIVITDMGTYQIRIFSPDGTFLTRFGREGEGPGEFRHIRVMGTVGSDTLVVMDGRQRRTSRFHPDSGFLGQTLLPEEVGITMHFNGMFGDGSVVFGGGVNWDRGEEETQPSGYERLTNPFYSVSLDGSEITHFGEFPGTEVVWKRGVFEGRETLSAGFPHFGKSPRAMARGDRFFLGTRDRYEINVFDPSGGLVRIVRVLIPPVAVTTEHLDGLLEEQLARLPDPAMEPAFRTGFRDNPHADHMPAFEALLLDSEGCLWVEDKNIPGDTLRTWTVFDRDGVPMTRLSLPMANRVLDIGEDFVLASFTDELDVEYVRVYSLGRGS